MNGRWILWLDGNMVRGVKGAFLTGPYDQQLTTVPVVPCDDAAVERATEAAMTAIVESNDVIAYGDEPFPGWALKLAERAIAAGFRAAGEVPS